MKKRIKKMWIYAIITVVALWTGYGLYVITDDVRAVKQEISTIDKNIVEAESNLNRLWADIEKTTQELVQFKVLERQFQSTKKSLKQKRKNKLQELKELEESKIFNF